MAAPNPNPALTGALGGASGGRSQPATAYQLPLSPWAARFEAADVELGFNDGQEHSGLAPLFPTLDALNYNDLPTQPQNMPSDEDLDRLFNTERWQQVGLTGLKSWQLGALNEHMGHMPYRGGHSANYDHVKNFEKFENHLFKIDETKWFNFIKKDRWLDLEEKIYSNERRQHIKFWTVNNPKIWAELRILIEYLNRVLNLLIRDRDPWLDTLLFGEFVRTDGVPIPATVQAEPDTYVLQERPLSSLPDRASYEALARQRLEDLNPLTRFSFIDEWDTEKGIGMVKGVTEYIYWQNQRRPTPIVALHTHQLRDLCEDSPPTLTPAEASYLRMDTALTLIHELMHSTAYNRRFDRFSTMSASGAEPYMRDDQLSEMGISFEKHLIGGAGLNSGNTYAGRPGMVNRWKYGAWAMESEDLRFIHSSYSQKRKDAVDMGDIYMPRRVDNVWHTPAFFPSFVFTEQYWDEVIGKKGRHALKPPAACFGTGQLRPEGGYRWHSVQESKIEPAVDELREPLERVRAELRGRNQQMAQLRPWYDAEYMLWQKSLWGWSNIRLMIQQFRRCHSQRDYRVCSWIIAAAANASEKVLKNPDDPVYASERLTYNIFWMLIFLMAASLPIKVVPQEVTTSYRNWYGTSLQNWQVVTTTMRRTLFNTIDEARMMGIQANVDPQHPLEYLDLVRPQLFPLRMHAVAGPSAWTSALINCYRDLLRQRQQPSVNPQEDWAEFNFEIPPYSRNAAYTIVFSAVVGGEVMVYPAAEPLWMEGIAPSPRIPLASELRPKDPEVFYTASEIAEKNWIIVNTSNAVPEVWNPQGIPVLGMDSSWNAQSQILESSPHGKVLKSDDDLDAEEFRLKIRAEPGRRMGQVLRWYRESEVLEFDGSFSKPLYKMDANNVYNITSFLSIATDDEADAVSSDNSQAPGYLDASKITDETWGRLWRYRCGALRPEVAQPITKPSDNPVLLTTRQLQSHDNPDNGAYIVLDKIIYDITDYLQHHPAHMSVLARLAGRDATAAFKSAHRDFASLNFAHAEHLIRQVGRVVDEWDPANAIPPDRFVVHGFVFRVEFDEYRRGYGGRDMTAHLSGPVTADTQDVLAHYDARAEKAVAKLTIPTEYPGAVSALDLQYHNDAYGFQGAWVANVEDNRVYDITTVLKFPHFFDNPPMHLANAAGRQISGASDWLRINLSHRYQGLFNRNL